MLKPDFTSAAFASDPSATLDELRKHSDVVPVKMPIMGKVWLTLSHEASSVMLKDQNRFTMRSGTGGTAAGVQWWMPRAIRLLANNLLTSDEPDHRRLRKLVDQAFQRRAVGEMEGKIRGIAIDLLSDLPDGGEFDVVSAYARKLPMAVICDLLGLTAVNRDVFAREAGKFTSVTGMASFLKAIWPIRTMRKLLEKIIDQERLLQQRGGSGSGLIAELVRAEANGDRFSRDELIAMVFLLLVAGHETTTHLISGSVLTLLQNPDQKDWLLADLTRMDLAVEELLRFVSPVQFTKPRIVKEAGPFFGVQLSKGDHVMACLAAANHDPVHFDNPAALDLARRPNPHVEFGTGIHFCLGFQLARLELKTALSVLFEAMPDIALSTAPEQWNMRVGLRSLKHLPVTP